MPRFMLDTDICSYIMKRTDEAVLRRVATIPLSDLCISAIIRSELEFGVAASPRQERDRTALDELIRDVPVLDFPGGAASNYGEIRALLKSRGVLIGANDMLIAAHARFLGLTLVTNNTREFQRVPGLKLENWAERAN
jgi:tRNA(fMet)-specific endonuclease VapC